MKKIFLIFLITVVLFLAACTPKPAVQDNTQSPVCIDGNTKYETCNQCSCVNGQWTCTEIACVACSGTWTNGQCVSTTQENNGGTMTGEVKEFTVEGDDLGLYPEDLTVNVGDDVKITFKVRTDNVYHAGLDFRGDSFNTRQVMPGAIKTIEFTATSTFTYSSYWPSTSVLKATGIVNVV